MLVVAANTLVVVAANTLVVVAAIPLVVVAAIPLVAVAAIPFPSMNLNPLLFVLDVVCFYFYNSDFRACLYMPVFISTL